jgi:O-antigen/teichoic acid export membrane protein
MNFLKGFSITASANVILVIVAFLNNVIITRQIGPEGRGQYTVIINLVMLLTLFLGEGVRRSNTIIVGKDNLRIKNVITTTFIYVCFTAVLLFLSLFLKEYWLYFFPNIPDSLIFLSLLIIVFAILWQAFQAIFLGIKEYYKFNFIQLLATLLTFLINLIGILFFSFQVYEIILSLLIATIISVIYGLFFLKEQLAYPKFSEIKKVFVDVKSLTFKSTLSALFIFIIMKSNIFIINYYLGSIETGIYSIAYIFLDTTQKLPNVASPILISKTVAESGRESINNTVKLVRVIFSINIFIILTLAFIGKYIIILLFKEDFADSYIILLYLLPAILFFGCGAIIYAYYMSKEYPINIIVINALFALIGLILNIVLIKIYGVIGAAIAISLTFVLWSFIMMYYFKIKEKLKILDFFIIKQQDILYIKSYFGRKK